MSGLVSRCPGFPGVVPASVPVSMLMPRLVSRVVFRPVSRLVSRSLPRTQKPHPPRTSTILRFLTRRPCAQVVRMLVASKWVWTPEIEMCVRDLFMTVAATKVVEDGWQKERHIETSHANRAISAGRAWMAPVYSQVLGKVHSFNELEHESQEVPRGAAGSLSRNVFHARTKDCSMPDARRIVGQSASTPWYSPSPLMSLATIADLEVYREARKTGRWADVSHAWLSILLWCDRGLLVCRTGDPNMYLPTASLGGIAGMGWPVDRVDVAGHTYYRPKVDVEAEDLKFLHVWDLSEWSAMSVQWVGPVHLLAAHGVAKRCGPLGRPDGPMQSLWELAARKGFWNLPKTPLVQLSRYMEVPIVPTMTLFEVVKACVMHALPGLPTDQLADILRRRTTKNTVYEEFLRDEDAVDLLEQSEQRQAKKIVTDVAKTEDETADYSRAYVGWYKTSVPKPKPKAKAQVRAPPRDSVYIGGKLFPKTFPLQMVDSQWTDVAVRPLLPPDDSRMYHDRVNLRWQLFWTISRVTRSASFVRYGHCGAAKLLLDAAWDRYESLGGEKRPWAHGE